MTVYSLYNVRTPAVGVTQQQKHKITKSLRDANPRIMVLYRENYNVLLNGNVAVKAL